MNIWRRLTKRWRKEPALPVAPPTGKYRHYRAGEALPLDWVKITLNDHPDASYGRVSFGCDVEVTLRDGWLNVHALEDGSPLRILCVRHASIHFNNDMRFYASDGKPLGQIHYSEGAAAPLEDWVNKGFARKFPE